MQSEVSRRIAVSRTSSRASCLLASPQAPERTSAEATEPACGLPAPLRGAKIVARGERGGGGAPGPRADRHTYRRQVLHPSEPPACAFHRPLHAPVGGD